MSFRSRCAKLRNSRVAGWIDAQPLETLYLSAIVVAELRFGVLTLPAGQRRDRLHEGLERQVLPLFTGRVLPFDLAASQAYAELMVKARSAGLAIGVVRRLHCGDGGGSRHDCGDTQTRRRSRRRG